MKALLTANYDSHYLSELRKHMDVEVAGFGVGDQLFTEVELIDRLADKDIFIVGYDQITNRVLEASEKLRLIASIRGGPEANIDLAAATRCGVPVLYTVGRTEHAVTEFVLATMFSFARPIYLANEQTRDGTLIGEPPSGKSEETGRPDGTAKRDVVWPLVPGTPAFEAHQNLFGRELYGKTLGIIGYGNIGRSLAAKATALGMQVMVYDPYVTIAANQAPAVVQSDELLELMAASDYVSLHVRVTKETEGMIGQKELKAMKSSSCLINTARAALVDRSALLSTLERGRIRGAALDVHHDEPIPLEDPFMKLPSSRVLLTPHIAGSTIEVEDHHSRLVNDAVLRFLNGAEELPFANPEVLESDALRDRGKLSLA